MFEVVVSFSGEDTRLLDVESTTRVPRLTIKVLKPQSQNTLSISPPFLSPSLSPLSPSPPFSLPPSLSLPLFPSLYLPPSASSQVREYCFDKLLQSLNKNSVSLSLEDIAVTMEYDIFKIAKSVEVYKLQIHKKASYITGMTTCHVTSNELINNSCNCVLIVTEFINRQFNLLVQ